MENLTIKNDKQAIFNLTSYEAYNTFQLGLNGNQHNWMRHPETQKLKEFVQNNTKYPEVYVKFNDFTKRIK